MLHRIPLDPTFSDSSTLFAAIFPPRRRPLAGEKFLFNDALTCRASDDEIAAVKILSVLLALALLALSACNNPVTRRELYGPGRPDGKYWNKYKHMKGGNILFINYIASHSAAEEDSADSDG